MLLTQSLNVPTDTHRLLPESCPQVIKNTFFAFVPSCTDLTEYLLHSSWQCEKFSSCFHPGYGLWGTDTASLSTHTSGYSDMYFPVLLCACCFCIALFTRTTEERRYLSSMLVLFSLWAFISSAEVEGDREGQHLNEEARMVCTRDDSCTTSF